MQNYALKKTKNKKQKINFYANKSYSTYSSFHIFIDSSMHLKPFNTCITKRFFFQYFLTTTENQNEAFYNYFNRRMNTIYHSFFQKKCILREKKLKIFPKNKFSGHQIF